MTGEPRAAVIVASTRAAAGEREDATGPVLVERLRSWGFAVDAARVVPDGTPVGDALRDALGTGARLVLTTGGTGLSPSDRTPEETAAVLDREVPGIAEAIRAVGVAAGVPTASLSRGIAGQAGDALVVNLPGSRGGVADALSVLESIVRHAVDQMSGGDH